MWWVGYDKVWLVPILELVVNVENIFTFGLSLSLSLSQGTERICRSFIFRTIFYTTTTTAGRSVFPFKRVADVPSHSLKLIEIKARALDVVDMAQINPPFR